MTSSGRYIPELDGLRFLAIGLVFWQHVQQHVVARSAAAGGLRWDLVSRYVESARIGVELFFLISGFILGLPFASQYLCGGRPVSLKQYFLRRLTRLEPPYLFVSIASLLLLSIYWGNSLQWLFPHFLAGLFYLHNAIYHTFNPVNSVTWSLEIEVQFYLLAPLLAKLFGISGKVRRRSVLVLVPLVAFTARQLVERSLHLTLPPTLLTALPSFMMGLLLADIYLTDWREQGPLEVGRQYAWDAAAAAIWFGLGWTFFTTLPAQSLLTALLLFLFCFAVFKGRVIRRWLAVAPIRLVGGMCYSIYLLHFMMLDLLAQHWPRTSLSGIVTVDVGAALVIFGAAVLVASSLFFLLVEKPCMDGRWPGKLGRRFSRQATLEVRQLQPRPPW